MRMIHNEIQRVRAEYLEMPGMRLKVEQVQRLCGIEPTMCQLVLDSLVESKFLGVKPDGHYARSTEGYSSRPQSENADVRTDQNR